MAAPGLEESASGQAQTSHPGSMAKLVEACISCRPARFQSSGTSALQEGRRWPKEKCFWASEFEQEVAPPGGLSRSSLNLPQTGLKENAN